MKKKIRLLLFVLFSFLFLQAFSQTPSCPGAFINNVFDEAPDGTLANKELHDWYLDLGKVEGQDAIKGWDELRILLEEGFPLVKQADLSDLDHLSFLIGGIGKFLHVKGAFLWLLSNPPNIASYQSSYDLSFGEILSLRLIGTNSLPLNQWLQGGSNAQSMVEIFGIHHLQGWSNLTSSALSKFPDFVLNGGFMYRVEKRLTEVNTWSIGETKVWDNMVAATEDQNGLSHLLTTYGNPSNFGNHDVVFKYVNSKGAKPIKDFTLDPLAKEVDFAAGTSFKIIDIKPEPHPVPTFWLNASGNPNGSTDVLTITLEAL